MANRFTPDRETLLTGDVRTLTLRIAVPSLLAMLSTGVCSLLDALYLSGEAPEVSAAVGVCFPLLTAQQAVGFTLGMGAGSHMSRSLGAGDRQSAQQAASTAVALALFLGLAMLAAGLCILQPMLSLLGAGDAVMPHAASYARWLLACAPLTCPSLVFSSLLRAQGKTPANLTAYAASSALGAALGWALISRGGLGVTGAGVSLLAREALALALLTRSTLREEGVLRPSPRGVTLRPWVFPAIMRSGLPTLLRQGMTSLSGAMTSRAAAAFGEAALSGMGVAVRVSALISSAAIGFGQGFQPVCGFNHGAGRPDRVREAYHFCQKTIVIALIAVGGAFFAFGGALLQLFRAQEQVAAVALQVLRAQSAVFFCQGAVIMMNMLTQSMGLTLRATLVAVSRQGLFLIPLLLILPRRFGLTGLILCQSAADVLALLFSWLLTRGIPARESVDRRRSAHYN